MREGPKGTAHLLLRVLRLRLAQSPTVLGFPDVLVGSDAQVRSSPKPPSPQRWLLIFNRQEEGCWLQVNLLEDPVPYHSGKKLPEVPMDCKGGRV